MNIAKYLFLCLLLISVYKSNELTCSCSMNTDDFGDKNSDVAEGTLVAVSPDNHVVEGENIGKLVSVAGLLVTQNNYTVKMSTTNLSLENNATCPKGYRKMSLEDLEKIANAVKGDDFNLVTDASKLNFATGQNFFTTEKLHPDNYNGGDLDAYKFKGFSLSSSSTEIQIGDKSTAMSGTTKKLKCVLEAVANSDGVELDTDYIQFVEYTVDTNITNTIDVEVELPGDKKYNSISSLKYSPQETGCYPVKIKFKMFDGTIVPKCDVRFVRSFFGSDADTTLAKSDVTSSVLEGISATRITSLHFNAATAPMCARAKGGAIILFREKDTDSLKAILLDKDLAVEKTLDLSDKAIPMAIAEVDDDSFVVYVKEVADTHHSYMAKYSTSGTKAWTENIMNNGDNASSAASQIDFYKDEGGARLFGMQAMFDPHNGELKVGRGRIFLIFAHYNNFDAESGGVDNHTGDTVISVNFDGTGMLLGNAWATSHSLTQRVVYDGKDFFTSSLGDAFPQQIKFLKGGAKYNNGQKDPKTQQTNRFSMSASDSIISGDIPGNGGGSTCGRLGGLSILNTSEFVKFAQTYARRPCSSGYSGNNTSTTKDEIGIVFFDKDLQVLSEHKLTTGNNVNIVKSAKYGKNIFVLYSRTTKNLDSTFLPAKYNEADDTSYMLLANSSGNVIVNEIELDEDMVNNDNLIELADGNVAWTYVADDGSMKLYKLKTPASTKPDENDEFAGSVQPETTSPETGNDSRDGGSDDSNISVSIVNCLGMLILLLFSFLK